MVLNPNKVQLSGDAGLGPAPKLESSARPASCAAAEKTDTELLDWLDDEACDLRCVSTANGDAGDHSLNWEVVEHYCGRQERVIGMGIIARDAIFDATLEPGDVRRFDYVSEQHNV